MKRFWPLLLTVLGLSTIPAKAQTAAFNGFCDSGGRSSVTSGLNSTNKLQQVIPSCTINVYITGTTTHATLTKDAIGTPLSNPFTAAALGSTAPGQWLFFAATGQGYDVVMSGGISPNTFPTPVTLTDLTSGGGGGTSGCGPLPGDNTSTNCGNDNLGGNTGAEVQTFGFENVNNSNTLAATEAFGSENLNNAAPDFIPGTLLAVGYGNENFYNEGGLGNSANTVSVGFGNLNGAAGHPCNIQDWVGVGDENMGICAEGSATGLGYNKEVISIGDANLFFKPSNTFGLNQVIAIGDAAYANLLTDGQYKNVIGIGNAPSNSLATMQDVVAIGDNPLCGSNTSTANVLDIVAIGDVPASCLNDGSNNMVAIGTAPLDGAGGSEVIGLGDSSADSSTGSDVIAIGDMPLSGANISGNHSTGHDIIAIGNQSAVANTTGSDIVAIGDGALQGFNAVSPILNTGSELIAIGDDALPVNTTGSDNVAIGDHAGGIGFVSGTNIGNSNQTGSHNTWIGPFAGPNTTTQLSNTIALGYQAFNTVSNQTVIGNSSITAVTIFGVGTGCLSASSGVITGSGSACGSGGGGGSNVTVNGGSTLTTANFGSLPAAGTNGVNVTWQNSGNNISAEIVGDGNASHFLNGTGTFTTPSGGGAVASVANSDGTLTISPTTGFVVASLALGHANTWTALQTFSAGLNLSGTTSPLQFAGSAGTAGQCPISGGAGATPSWGSCGSGGSGISGLTAGFIPKAGSATTLTANSHIDDGVTTAATLTATEPIAVNDGTGNAGVIQPHIGTDPGGVAGSATYTTDATSGFAEVHEGTGALSRICTAANGVCPGGSLTDNVLLNAPSTGLFFANTDSIGLLAVGGFPELLATKLGIPSGNQHINAIGSASLADMLSCNTPGSGNCTQDGTWPLTFPLGVTSNSKALLEAAYNDVSNIGGAPNSAQLSYYAGGLKAWMLEFGIPDSQKIAANASICTTTGTWTSVSAVPGGAGTFPAGTLQTLTPGATITCTTRNATDAGIIGYKFTGSSSATYTVNITNAGVTYNVKDPYTGSTTLNQNAPYTSFWGGVANFYAVGQAGMGGGYTTITLTAASNSSDPVIVVAPYFISPSSGLQNFPAVEMMLESRAGCNGTCSTVAGPQHNDANTNIMRTAQMALVNELRSNGLNISYFDPNATPSGYNSSDPTQTADGTHPNSTSAPFIANAAFVNLNSAATTQDHFLPVVASGGVTVPTTPNFLNAPGGTLTAIPNIVPVVFGGGSSFNGIGIQGGTGLTTYYGTVATVQGANSLNTVFNGGNWPYTASNIAGAYRLLNSSGSDSGFQVSVCPSGTAGAATNMDSTCVGLYLRSNGSSGNQVWFNPQLTNPTFPTNAALVANPSANWFVDYSGNTTTNNLTVNGTCTGCGGGSSPLTTKGDLFGFSTVNARVPVGTNGQVLTADSTNANGVSWQTGGGGSSAFSAITSSTNTTAAMVVGAGASLNFTSTGTINASTLLGGTWAIPGAIGATTPSTGVFTPTLVTKQGSSSITQTANSSANVAGTAYAAPGLNNYAINGWGTGNGSGLPGVFGLFDSTNSKFVWNTNTTDDMCGNTPVSNVAICVGATWRLDHSGLITGAAFQSFGTKFTTSGCSVSSTTGGAAAGVFTLGANSCTVVITMNGATGLTAINGWSCFANDRTSSTVFAIQQTASSTTTATFSIPATAGATDVINFGCTAY
jgi:hypothetical protein